MSLLYKRLVKVNKENKDNGGENLDKYRIVKRNSTYCLESYVQKTPMRPITTIDIIWDLFRHNRNLRHSGYEQKYVYITNISLLRNAKKVLNNFYIDRYMCVRIHDICKECGYLNSFSIDHVENSDMIIYTTILTGNLLYDSPCLSIVCTKNKDLKILVDKELNLIVDDFTELTFSELNIKKINFTGLDISRVTKLDDLFLDCVNTEIINIDLDSNHIKSFRNMFNGCVNLKELYVNDFKVDKLMNFSDYKE